MIEKTCDVCLESQSMLVTTIILKNWGWIVGPHTHKASFVPVSYIASLLFFPPLRQGPTKLPMVGVNSLYTKEASNLAIFLRQPPELLGPQT